MTISAPIGFATNTWHTGSPSATLSSTVDIGTRTNGLLVVSVHARSDVTSVTGVTWNGVALSFAGRAVETLDIGVFAEMWYLPNPANGSNTVEVTLGTALSSWGYIVTWYDDADQSDPLNVVETANATTGLPTDDILPTEDTCIIISSQTSEANDALSAGSGETLITSFDRGVWVFGSSYVIQGTAATHTMDWTGLSSSWAMVTASFKSAVTNSPPTVALDTPADTATVTTATPTFAFTGSDADSDDIRYNLQVATTNSFAGLAVTDSHFLT